MNAREKLTQLGCDRHHCLGNEVYCGLGNEVYCGIDTDGCIWLVTKDLASKWHLIALDDKMLASLYRYAEDWS
jgi:hypothetical protein